MKKIISLLCAVAMLGSFAFTTVQAADEPEMVASITEKMFYEKYSDHPQYEVTVSLNGFSEVGELENVGDDFDPGYKGNNILMAQGFMTYDQNKYTLMAAYTEKTKAEGTWTINTDTKGQIAFLWNTTTMEEMIDTADTDLVKFYFISRDNVNKVPGAPVPDNENIVAFVSGDPSMSGKVDIATFNGGTTYTTDISYSSEGGTMVNVAKPLKEVVVEDKTPAEIIDEEVNPEVAPTDVAYTQGFKATVAANDQIVKNVLFTLTNNDGKTYDGKFAEGEFTFSGVEASFAINVINIPAGKTVACAWDIEAVDKAE